MNIKKNIFTMSVITISLTLLLICNSLAVASSEYKVDYFFIIDCSGSMVGKGQGNPANIFPDVKKAVKDFIDTVEDGSNVYILPFHKGVQDQFILEINSDEDREKLKKYIDSLRAEGQVTWIYKSLEAALNLARKARSGSELPHVQVILLYTDGLDNGPENLTFDQIIQRFRIETSDNKYLYLKYITLGVDLPKDQAEVLNRVENIELVKEKKGSVSEIVLVKVTPLVLDFGSIITNPHTLRTVKFEYDKDIKGIEVNITTTLEQAEKKGAIVSVNPEKFKLGSEQKFSLNIANKEVLLSKQPPWDYEGKVTFSASEQGKIILFSPETISLRFNTAPERLISLIPQSGREYNFAYGTIRLSENESLSKEYPFNININDAALLSGAWLEVALKAIEQPQELIGKQIGLKYPGETKLQDKLRLDSEHTEFVLVVSPKGGLKPGKYEYELYFVPHMAELKGSGLAKSKVDPNLKAYQISFEIPEPPAPLWLRILRLIGLGLLLLLILGIISLLIYSYGINTHPVDVLKDFWNARFKKLIIEDGTFRVIYPLDEDLRKPFSIMGREKVLIGTGGDFLTDMKNQLEIRPVREDGEEILKIINHQGNVVEIVHRNKEKDYLFEGNNARLRNGDELIIDGRNGEKYKIKFESLIYQ